MKVIDLFAGCGGLSSGFHEKGFNVVAHLDWDKFCIETLNKNFGNFKKLGYETKLFNSDIRNTSELFSKKTDSFSNWIESNGSIDGIIGGPPCQAYSIAGRVRDPDGMKNDYRNYLFEAYADILDKIQPKFFIFENVPGILSSSPDGESIIFKVFKAFSDINFCIEPITKNHLYDLAGFGGPQKRKRLIIFGINNNYYQNKTTPIKLIRNFYENLNTEIVEPKTLFSSIGDLDKIYPLEISSNRISHEYSGNDKLHSPRFHNMRDIEIFKILTNDALSSNPIYSSVKSRQQLYVDKIGKFSNIHKYNVLKWNQPSNLIPAHLYKDGLRHIHPDPEQARSITAREAARLQTFSDEYNFVGPKTNIYRMIGNAVAPLMASKIASSIKNLPNFN